jgi:hypothetical protein
MAVLASEALRILAAHDLLAPRTAILTGWRSPFGGAAMNSEVALESSEIEVALPADASPDAASLTDFLVRSALDRRAFPEILRFRGTGKVFDSSGDSEEVADPVSLEIQAGFEIAAHLSTNLTVWLPYALDGQEQWDISAANLPRLSTALRDLATLREISVSHVDYTRHAEVDADGLRNHTDYFGRPVAVEE